MLALTAAVALAMAPVWRGPGNGPVHDGRAARDWLLELMRPEPARQETARAALTAMGDGLIPFLRTELARRDAWLKRAWLDMAGPVMGWTPDDAVRDAQWRTAAIRAAGALGPRGAVLMPELLAAYFEQSEVRGTYGYAAAFGGIGAAAAPALLDALNASRTPPCPYDDELLLCLANIHLDQALSSNLQDATVQTAIQRLKAPRGDFGRLAAIKAIRSMPDRGEPAIGALIGVTSDPRASFTAHELSLAALAEIGRRPDLCVPHLLRSLDNVHPSIRLQATKSLGAFELSPDPSAIVALAGRLDDPSTPVQLAALSVLGRIGADAVEAAPAVARALNASEPSVRAMAAKSLPRVGANPALAVPALAGVLKDDDRDTRLNAAKSLGMFGSAAGSSVDELISLLRDDHREAIQITVADALGNIGPVAHRAAPDLVAAWNNNQSAMRVPVLRAMRRIGAPVPGENDPSGEGF